MKKKAAYSLSPVLLLALICSTKAHKLQSQKRVEPYYLKQFDITVNADDHITKTHLLHYNKTIRLNNNRVYMWYASQKIMETKGGFDGKLIHGHYNSFYFNGQLKEKGDIRYGLKHKQWRHWTREGQLKEVICWNRGIKKGQYLLYDDAGQLMARGHFKKDKLHGKFTTYGSSGNIIEKKRYRNGLEVPPLAKVFYFPPKPGRLSQPAKAPKQKKKKEKPKDEHKNESILKEVSWLQKLFKKKSNRSSTPVQERKITNS